MRATTLNNEKISFFDYNEFEQLIPHLTTMQFLIVNNYCIRVINSVLKGLYKATRENKIEDITAYNYYGHFPSLDKENKIFYFAAIVSYLRCKEFQVSYTIIDEQNYLLRIQW